LDSPLPLKLPKCKQCGHQFGWKEMIKSQWRYVFKLIHCKVCDTKFKIKNSLLLYLLLFMVPSILYDLAFKNNETSKDFSLTSFHFLTELTTSFLILIMIFLILPFIARLGAPIKDQ